MTADGRDRRPPPRRAPLPGRAGPIRRPTARKAKGFDWPEVRSSAWSLLFPRGLDHRSDGAVHYPQERLREARPRCGRRSARGAPRVAAAGGAGREGRGGRCRGRRPFARAGTASGRPIGAAPSCRSSHRGTPRSEDVPRPPRRSRAGRRGGRGGSSSTGRRRRGPSNRREVAPTPPRPAPPASRGPPGATGRAPALPRCGAPGSRASPQPPRRRSRSRASGGARPPGAVRWLGRVRGGRSGIPGRGTPPRDGSTSSPRPPRGPGARARSSRGASRRCRHARSWPRR